MERVRVRKKKRSKSEDEMQKENEKMASHPLVLVEPPLDTRDTTKCWIGDSSKDGRRDINVSRTSTSRAAVHNFHNDGFAVAGVRDRCSEGDVTLKISLRIAVGQTIATNQD